MAMKLFGFLKILEEVGKIELVVFIWHTSGGKVKNTRCRQQEVTFQGCFMAQILQVKQFI